MTKKLETIQETSILSRFFGTINNNPIAFFGLLMAIAAFFINATLNQSINATNNVSNDVRAAIARLDSATSRIDKVVSDVATSTAKIDFIDQKITKQELVLNAILASLEGLKIQTKASEDTFKKFIELISTSPNAEIAELRADVKYLLSEIDRIKKVNTPSSIRSSPNRFILDSQGKIVPR